MSISKRAIIFTFAAILTIGTAGAGEAKGQNVLREILDRMDKHYKAMQSMEASLARTIYQSQLRETDEFSGKVVLVPGKGRDASIRLDWTRPREEILSIANSKYQLYIPSIKTAYRGSTSSQKAKGSGGGALRMLSMSEAELRKNFAVDYIGQVSLAGTDVWHIKLDPKTKQDFKFSEMWVDKDGMPIQVRITAQNNDTDTFRFSNIKRNNRIPGSTFAVKVAKGTEILDQ